MYDNESRIERAKRFAKVWWKSRDDVGKSQEFMALSMGVSKKTIQNWEKGLNPIKYYMEFLYPNFFDKTSLDNESELNEKLNNLIKISSAKEKKELIYIMSGTHGSSWPALLQLFAMYCQISLQSRVIVAKIVLENYEMEEKMGRLVNSDKIKPDLELLKSAISICKAATKNGYYGYSTVFFKELESDIDNNSEVENKKSRI